MHYIYQPPTSNVMHVTHYVSTSRRIEREREKERKQFPSRPSEKTRANERELIAS